MLFGPQYHKFREAKALIEAGAAVSIQNADELKAALENYLSGEEALHKAGKAAANYVLQNAGASETVIKYIQEKRLLTR